MAAARKSSRHGHRDTTMILIGYRHGLRASELCDLQWSEGPGGATAGDDRKMNNEPP
jgi:integrase